MRNFKRDGKTSGNSDFDFFVWKYALYKSYRIAPHSRLIDTFIVQALKYINVIVFTKPKYFVWDIFTIMEKKPTHGPHMCEIGVLGLKTIF